MSSVPPFSSLKKVLAESSFYSIPTSQGHQKQTMDERTTNPVTKWSKIPPTTTEKNVQEFLISLPVELADQILNKMGYNELAKVIMVARDVMRKPNSKPRIKYLVTKIIKIFTEEPQNNNLMWSNNLRIVRYQNMAADQSPSTREHISLQVLLNILTLHFSSHFISEDKLYSLKFSSCLEPFHLNSPQLRTFIWQSLILALENKKIYSVRYHIGVTNRGHNNRTLRWLSETTSAVSNNQQKPQEIPYSTAESLEYVEAALPSRDDDEIAKFIRYFERLPATHQTNVMAFATLLRKFASPKSPFCMLQLRNEDDLVEQKSHIQMTDNSNYVRHYPPLVEHPMVFDKAQDQVIIRSIDNLQLLNKWTVQHMVSKVVRSDRISTVPNSMPLTRFERGTRDYRDEIITKILCTTEQSMPRIAEIEISARDWMLISVQKLTPQSIIDWTDNQFVSNNNLDTLTFKKRYGLNPIPEVPNTDIADDVIFVDDDMDDEEEEEEDLERQNRAKKSKTILIDDQQ